MNPAALHRARAMKQRTLEALSARAKVVGVGITKLEGGYGLKVNLEELPPADTPLPDNIEGVPVRFEVVGKIRKR